MKSELMGPFELNYDTIAVQVPTQVCGTYALGHIDRSSVFRIERVGRADADLQVSLRNFIGCSMRFKFIPSLAPKQAFEIECELFHQFRPPGNFIHPHRPAGADWTCPVCSAMPVR